MAVLREDVPGQDSILTPDAQEFVRRLVWRFGADREILLARRAERQRAFRAGELPDFLHETAAVRAADWTVAPAPTDLDDRRVEITGPTDAKMMINALNSGASVFMADFEDALSPPWANVITGQVNCKEAIRGNPPIPESRGQGVSARLPHRHLSFDRAGGTSRRRTSWSTAAPHPHPCSTSASTSSTTPTSCSRAAAGRTSTCPSWKAISKPGCGTRSSMRPRTHSASHAGRSGRPC